MTSLGHQKVVHIYPHDVHNYVPFQCSNSKQPQATTDDKNMTMLILYHGKVM